MSTAVALSLAPDERPHTALIHPVIDAHGVMELHNAITEMVQKTLVDGKDFGIIPGTKKPSLYKSGAERLCVGFGLVDTYEILEKEIDHTFENAWTKHDRRGNVYASGTAKGLYRYTVKCHLRRREDDTLVAEGVGACSSLEAKYQDRPRECENTILKMAKKRAKVDATLSGLGLSDRFTQDTEDLDLGRGVEDEHGHATTRPKGEEVQARGTAGDTPAHPGELQMPIGHSKGKCLKDIETRDLQGAMAWCREATRETWENWRASMHERKAEVEKYPKGDSARAWRDYGHLMDDYEGWRQHNEASAICHLPEAGRPARVWWFGFDCAHCDDASPGSIADYPDLTSLIRGVYRDRAYVEGEVRSLAAQLAALAAVQAIA